MKRPINYFTMKTSKCLLLVLLLTQKSLLLNGSNIAEDSLKFRSNNFSGVFVHIGGIFNTWAAVNYQQMFLSKKFYSLGALTNINVKEKSNSSFRVSNDWFIINSVNSKYSSYEIGLGVRLLYLSDDYYIISPDKGVYFFTLYPNKIESDLILQHSFRFNISKRFFIKLIFLSKIYDLSPNYTRYFFCNFYGKRELDDDDLHSQSFSISFIGLTSNPSRKNTYRELYNKSNNAILINILNSSFGYERRIAKIKEHSFYASYQNIFIPYKKYNQSNKRGFLFVPALAFNYSYSTNDAFTPIIGLSYHYYYDKFSVYDKFFNRSANYLRSNIGLKCAIYKNLFTKITYSPKIILFSQYKSYNIENSLIYLRKYDENKINLFFTVGYAF